jgi:hypothetical protein
MSDKLKGALLIITSICSIIFVFISDRLIDKPFDFGWYSAFMCLAAIITIINGMRVYRRNDAQHHS